VSNSSEAIGQTTTGKRRYSKILVDGGDPQGTAQIRQLIGFVGRCKSGRHGSGYAENARQATLRFYEF